MKKVRKEVFETNSSSTHSLVLDKSSGDGYVPASDKIIIDFIDTNDERVIYGLRAKVSYLVSHIIDKYMYDCTDYEDLVEQVSRDYDFKRIENYVMEKFGKKVVFPKNYDGDIEYIVNINHQLRESCLENVLEDLVSDNRELLDIVLAPDQMIEIGHD